MAALEAQLELVDAELRRFARDDERCQALQSIYGVGPILAWHHVVWGDGVGFGRRHERLWGARGMRKLSGEIALEVQKLAASQKS